MKVLLSFSKPNLYFPFLPGIQVVQRIHLNPERFWGHKESKPWFKHLGVIC